MTIDVYTATGEKKGTVELPATLFAAPVHSALMHRMVILQRSNARRPIAHVKTRGEVVGSTRKLYQQKGTGRARRGPIRSPLLRGGGKTFGPRKERNFVLKMSKGERHAALFSCLSSAAKQGKVLGLEGYGFRQGSEGQEGLRGASKTKTFVAFLKKLPVPLGRKILFVLPKHMEALERGSRNVPGVKTVLASYLNPVDVLGAHSIVFLVDALRVAEETFGGKSPKILKKPKKPTNRKSLDSLDSLDSLVSSPESSISSKKHS